MTKTSENHVNLAKRILQPWVSLAVTSKTTQEHFQDKFENLSLICSAFRFTQNTLSTGLLKEPEHGVLVTEKLTYKFETVHRIQSGNTGFPVLVKWELAFFKFRCRFLRCR